MTATESDHLNANRGWDDNKIWSIAELVESPLWPYGRTHTGLLVLTGRLQAKRDGRYVLIFGRDARAYLEALPSAADARVVARAGAKVLEADRKTRRANYDRSINVTASAMADPKPRDAA